MDIFKYVNDVVDYYEKIEDKYRKIAVELQKKFEEILMKRSKYALTVSVRVKEPESIREKLIRNSYYRLHTTKEEIIANVQDIIGIRIECKFTEDEKYVYSLIEKIFHRTDDQIYFYSEDFPKMRLKLTDHQPVKQKNGFDIYKIDGRYEDKEGGKNERINFEIQIKSMVNMFWGEIEHKIIYKNSSYFMVEQEVIESMSTIKENLSLIDKQLHKLYKKYKREDGSGFQHNRENIEHILSKLIHDTFARKMKNEFGFVVQFKETCDAIVDYIFVVNDAAQMADYGRVLMETFYMTDNISKNRLSFREPIVLEHAPNTGDGFIDTVYVAIQKMMNVDFNWHLFFKILFELEQGNHAYDMESFLRYYKGRIMAGADLGRLKEVYNQEQAAKIKNDLMDEMGYVFRRHADIALLYRNGMEALTRALKSTVYKIIAEKPDWDKEKSIYFLNMNNNVNIEAN